MIEVRSVRVRAGKHLLDDISLTVPKGKYAVLMGKTGSGKTTILESICGLRRIEHGSIHIDQVNVTHFTPGSREIGYVPQDVALFPSMTVRENLAFALRLRRLGGREISTRVDELSTVLNIGSILGRRAINLSGGEAQRVALGRALAFRPKVLLLDEPLSALDEETRDETIELLRSVQSRFHITTLHITHNRTEAERLADLRFYLSDVSRGQALTVFNAGYEDDVSRS
jgi:molybdate transport system ATP-binding protein/molybdate/tungstate transport system ATP-binding protein